VNFRIRKGTHVSHFHRRCPLWPAEDYYEQEKPLWWGELCEECLKLAGKSGSDPDFSCAST
jgi:hypothetical protein